LFAAHCSTSLRPQLKIFLLQTIWYKLQTLYALWQADDNLRYEVGAAKVVDVIVDVTVVDALIVLDLEVVDVGTVSTDVRVGSDE
jgi:hypothetical protein